jgi:hypothetical protein
MGRPDPLLQDSQFPDLPPLNNLEAAQAMANPLVKHPEDSLLEVQILRRLALLQPVYLHLVPRDSLKDSPKNRRVPLVHKTVFGAQLAVVVLVLTTYMQPIRIAQTAHQIVLLVASLSPAMARVLHPPHKMYRQLMGLMVQFLDNHLE